MGIKAKNNTLVPLILKDYYLWDPNLNSGYYGAVEYRLPAGGKKKLSSSKFARKLMEELKPQEIHVKIGDETRLVLHHDELENIKAIYLEMENVDAGDLTVRFVKRGDKISSSSHRICRGVFPFCGAGAEANMQTPIANAGTDLLIYHTINKDGFIAREEKASPT